MESTWERRDLPVLRGIVRLYDENPRSPVTAGQLEAATGLPGPEVQSALFALAAEEPPFFTPVDGSSAVGSQIAGAARPTGHARRTVGTWPTPELLADRIVNALNEAADQETDEVRKGKLRQLAGILGGFGRDVLVDVTAQVITRSSGI